MNATSDSVAISIEVHCQVVRTIVDILDRIRTIGLCAERDSKVILALGRSTETCAWNRCIVLVVAGSRYTDEVDSGIEIHTNQRILAKVIIVLSDEVN